MNSLSSNQLLHVWEVGPAQAPLQRALTLLAAAWPDTPRDALADLSIGQRNHRLLRLRAATFGPALTCLATCPRCGEPAEVAFDVVDITLGDDPDPAATVSVRSDGYDVEARVPTTRDVLAAASDRDVATIRRRLLERCIVAAHREGEPVAAGELPEPVVAELVRRIADADAQAEIRLALACPACGQPWEEMFDILAYFWAEIDAWANRLVHDVHALASAYGWREADILAMSPVRRRRYLDLVGA